MRLILASALILAPSVAFAHTGHPAPEGPLHGLAHAIGTPENLLAIGLITAVAAAGAVLLAVLNRKGRKQR